MVTVNFKEYKRKTRKLKCQKFIKESYYMKALGVMLLFFIMSIILEIFDIRAMIIIISIFLAATLYKLIIVIKEKI